MFYIFWSILFTFLIPFSLFLIFMFVLFNPIFYHSDLLEQHWYAYTISIMVIYAVFKKLFIRILRCFVHTYSVYPYHIRLFRLSFIFLIGNFFLLFLLYNLIIWRPSVRSTKASIFFPVSHNPLRNSSCQSWTSLKVYLPNIFLLFLFSYENKTNSCANKSSNIPKSLFHHLHSKRNHAISKSLRKRQLLLLYIKEKWWFILIIFYSLKSYITCVFFLLNWLA